MALSQLVKLGLLKFSEMTEEQKKSYMDKYENEFLTGKHGFMYLNPEKEFNDQGLRFPLKYLNEVGLGIIFFPVEIMAGYVDVITKTCVDAGDEDFVKMMKESPFDVEKNIKRFNATSCGNMAYVYLNSKDEELRKKADEILNAVFHKAYNMIMDLVKKQS